MEVDVVVVMKMKMMMVVVVVVRRDELLMREILRGRGVEVYIPMGGCC